jgi:hypothetical protein
MPVKEATWTETPYGRYVTSERWFVLNLGDALAAGNEEGAAAYPLEPREHPFRDGGVNVKVVPPDRPASLYHSEAHGRVFAGPVGVGIVRVSGLVRDRGCVFRSDLAHRMPDCLVFRGLSVPRQRRDEDGIEGPSRRQAPGRPLEATASWGLHLGAAVPMTY